MYIFIIWIISFCIVYFSFRFHIMNKEAPTHSWWNMSPLCNAPALTDVMRFSEHCISSGLASSDINSNHEVYRLQKQLSWKSKYSGTLDRAISRAVWPAQKNAGNLNKLGRQAPASGVGMVRISSQFQQQFHPENVAKTCCLSMPPWPRKLTSRKTTKKSKNSKKSTGVQCV